MSEKNFRMKETFSPTAPLANFQKFGFAVSALMLCGCAANSLPNANTAASTAATTASTATSNVATIASTTTKRNTASLGVAWGVNLAGAEFGSAIPGLKDKDYTWPTEAEFAYYAKKNMRLIRVPFLWERMQHSPFSALDATYLNDLKTVMSNAQKHGVQVIPDCHNYCRYKELGVEKTLGRDLDKRALGDLWKKMAPQLKTYKSLWGYDLMNEPRNLGPNGDSEGEEGKNIWRDTAQDAINQIRSVDSSTRIIVSGYQFSPADNWTHYSDGLKTLVDPGKNLIYQAHQYFDADKSGSYNAQSGGYDFQKQTGGDAEVGKKRVQDYIQWLRVNKKKGILGEFSIPASAEWQPVLKNFLAEIKNDDDVLVGCTYWAGGPWWDRNAVNRADIEPDYAWDNKDIDTWKDRPQMLTYLQVTGGGATSKASKTTP